MNQERRNNRKLLLIILALALVCAVSVMGTLAYLSQKTEPVVNTFVAAGGGNITDPDSPEPPTVEDGTITNGNFYLIETKVSYENGKYKLPTGSAVKVLKNDYDMAAPQMVIPKDPTLTANVADGAEVYIFVKVTDTTDTNLSYSLTSDWTEVNGATLGTNEKLYLYKNKITSGTEGVELDATQILTSNQVTIADDMSDTITGSEQMDLGSLTFQGYICQAGGFENAAAAYNACFGSQS